MRFVPFLVLLSTTVFAQLGVNVLQHELSLSKPVIRLRDTVDVSIRTRAPFAKEPIELYATATWEFDGQTYETRSNTVMLNVMLPVYVTLDFPVQSLTYVADSAKLNGVQITPEQNATGLRFRYTLYGDEENVLTFQLRR